MPEDNQQQKQSTYADLQKSAIDDMRSQLCLLPSFVGIPHDYDLSYNEDSEPLPGTVKNGILEFHYFIVYKTLKEYVFKETYTGEESLQQSACPLCIAYLISRCC